MTVRLPVGEAAKTVAVARQAWTRLAEFGLERSDVIVGLGGGAATDVAGFLAATYHRGVPWIAVPTSLVGMVDAAIGGKTGIDLPAAKNAVGAFHQPEWVVSDPSVLETLPVREWASGFAEVIKTALLAGGRLWEMVREWEPGRGTPDQRLELIRRCAAYKVRVVAADPTEQGRRAVLNLGHSIGHAIEVATEYKAFAHGEAVGIGLLSALWLSAQSEGLDPGIEPEVRALLRRHGLPVTARNVSPTAIIDAMARDKKARAGRVRFALLEGVGSPVWGRDPGDDLIEAAVARAVAKRTIADREPHRHAGDRRRRPLAVVAVDQHRPALLAQDVVAERRRVGAAAAGAAAGQDVRRREQPPAGVEDANVHDRLEDVGAPRHGDRGRDAGADGRARDHDRRHEPVEVGRGGRLGHRDAGDRVDDLARDLEANAIDRRELGGGERELREPHAHRGPAARRGERPADVDRRGAAAGRDPAQPAARRHGGADPRRPLGTVGAGEELLDGGTGDTRCASDRALGEPQLAAALEPHLQGHRRPGLRRRGGRTDAGERGHDRGGHEDEAFGHDGLLLGGVQRLSRR